MLKQLSKSGSIRKRSIQGRLSFAFILMIALVIFAGGVGITSIKLLQQTYQQSLEAGFTLNELALQARSDMNTVQRLVTLFLASYEESGLETASNTYLSSLGVHIDAIEQSLTAIDELGMSDAEGEPVSTTQAVQYVVSYETGVNRLTDQIAQRGVRDDGLIGAFNSTANALKGDLARQEDYRLQQFMIALEKTEKNYFYYGDAITSEDLSDLIVRIQVRFQFLNSVDYVRADIDGVSEQYLTTFQAVVDADAHIHRAVISNEAQVSRLNSALDDLETLAAQLIDEAQKTLDKSVRLIYSLVGTTALVATILGIGVAISSIRLITRPLHSVVQATERFATGDMDARVTIKRNDEIGQLGATFNDMAANLQTLLQQEQDNRLTLESTIVRYMNFVQAVAAGDLTTRLDLNDAAHEDDLYRLGHDLNGMVESLKQMAEQVRLSAARLSTATAEILTATTEQSVSVTEQNAALNQTMATLAEVRTTITQTAQQATTVAQTAQRSVAVSYEGQGSVVNSVAGMQQLQDQVNDIAQSILALSEQTQQIGTIITSVNDIADQSSLLALNASIEAARAGVSGRGFAVVAQEVRQLAEESRQATASIGGILGDIQQTTDTAVMVTEEGTKGAEHAVTLVGTAGSAIDGLTEIIEQAAQAVQQIEASTGQQISGMDQLLAAMTVIKNAINKTAATTEQTAHSAQNLSNMAHEMEEAAARYRL